MSLSKSVLHKKLDFLNEQLTKIEGMDFDESALKNNEDIQDLLTFRLQQGIETCIDIATHIIAGLSLQREETAKDAFLILGRQNIVTADLALRMAKAADFRNRVVHGYNDFDFSLLYKDYKSDSSDLRKFGGEILAFLKKQTQPTTNPRHS